MGEEQTCHPEDASQGISEGGVGDGDGDADDLLEGGLWWFVCSAGSGSSDDVMSHDSDIARTAQNYERNALNIRQIEL